MDVISLLQNKKRCLRRFLEVSDRFRVEAEGGDLSGLAQFESNRETVLKTLALIDSRITEAVRQIPLAERTAALSHAVQESLDEEAYLVQSILNADNRIVACIEAAKQQIAQEIAGNRRSRENSGRFKSTWIAESGEGLDQKA